MAIHHEERCTLRKSRRGDIVRRTTSVFLKPFSQILCGPVHLPETAFLDGKAASIVIANPIPFVKTVILLFLMLATLPALAQRHDQFYNGVQAGGRGGNYYNQRDRNWDRRHRRDQGGVGPGTGALIGAAGGAVLGAALGGSLESTLVTGAAGAGIGAILGQANKDSKRNNRRYR
jgi:hypothetical protein